MRKIPLAFMMEMDILYLPPKKPGGASCLARVPMDMDELLILVIYNQEDLASRGDPGEFGALQATSVTARAAHKALLRQGYHAVEIPLSGSLDDLRSQLSPFSPQNAFIFNMCDEFGGTNAGLVDAVKAIEGLGFRHTASSPEVISLCVDKPRAKQRILEAGVDTPAFKVFEIPDVVCDLEFPLIVKPSREDGSLGIHVDAVAHNAEGLRWRVERILESYHQPAMAERFILGREFAVPLWGNEPVQSLPISEMNYTKIQDPYERILSYEAKWELDSFYSRNISVICPADLTQQERWTVTEAALTVYKAFGLVDYARIDVRFADGVPYVVDVNEVPELALDTGFCYSALQAGYSYEDVIEKILNIALKREGIQ